VILTATGCAGRVLNGTVSLSPGKTVWAAGQTTPGNGPPAGTASNAKAGDRARALQDRTRNEQQARTGRSRSGKPNAVDGSNSADGSAGTTGMSPAVAPPAPAPRPATTTPDSAPAPTIEAGMVRRLTVTRSMEIVGISALVIVIGMFAAQRFRHRKSSKGNIRPFER
jgi:hypothetical protein